MADVIEMANRRSEKSGDKPTAIEVVPVPLNRLEYVTVFANHHGPGDQRGFRSMCRAVQYAAALSAKHGVPIVPAGAAVQHFADSL